MILSALEEVGGQALAARHAKAKKAELSHSAERIFAGDFIGEIEVKERALAWVPDPMRFAAPSATAPAEETPPWEELPSNEPLPSASDVDAREPEPEPEPERGAGVEEAPCAEREEIEQAA